MSKLEFIWPFIMTGEDHKAVIFSPFFFYFRLISAFQIFFPSLELNSIDSSLLNWKKCSRKSAPKKDCSKRSSSSLVDDIILRRNKKKNSKNCSSKLKDDFVCACQKLKDSMDFGLSW